MLFYSSKSHSISKNSENSTDYQRVIEVQEKYLPKMLAYQ